MVVLGKGAATLPAAPDISYSNTRPYIRRTKWTIAARSEIVTLFPALTSLLASGFPPFLRTYIKRDNRAESTVPETITWYDTLATHARVLAYGC